MGFTMDMHDDAFNSPLLIFARCGNNNLHNLQVDGGGKQVLKDVNGDEAHLFKVHMENVVTLVLGSRPRQRGYKGAGQEEARESHHILPGV
jgi:hypothetical protein